MSLISERTSDAGAKAVQKASREKVLLSENVQIKIILDIKFRYLIASSGIARQGLN